MVAAEEGRARRQDLHQDDDDDDDDDDDVPPAYDERASFTAQRSVVTDGFLYTPGSTI